MSKSATTDVCKVVKMAIVIPTLPKHFFLSFSSKNLIRITYRFSCLTLLFFNKKIFKTLAKNTFFKEKMKLGFRLRLRLRVRIQLRIRVRVRLSLRIRLRVRWELRISLAEDKVKGKVHSLG